MRTLSSDLKRKNMIINFCKAICENCQLSVINLNNWLFLDILPWMLQVFLILLVLFMFVFVETTNFGVGRWLGNESGSLFTIIDTPGFGDSGTNSQYPE